MASITESLIQDVQIGDNSPARIASSAYGICNTAANEITKVVEMKGFVIMQGVTIHVKFTNANTASSPRLNVQTSGAYPIMQYGTTGAGTDALTTSWPAGAIVSFTFDGTNWVMNFGVNTDTQYSVQNTYDNTSNNPISGQGVAAAIGTLDITAIQNTAGKTVETITEQDGKVGATFQDIEITESQVTNLTTDLAAKAPINNPTFTGTVTLPAAGPQSDNEAATKKYVDDMNVGITGAMHYIPTVEDSTHTITITKTTGTNGAPDKYTISGTGLPENYTPIPGDVIIHEHQEYIYGSATLGWRLLGDEGSYALKTNTISVVKEAALTKNTLPTLTITPKTIPNVTSAGSAPSLGHTEFNITQVTANSSPTQAKVENGTLKITIGSASTSAAVEVSKITSWNAGAATQLGTAIEVGSASNWSQGTQASLANQYETVVKP